MSYVYYWTDKIPANPDKTLSPEFFFDSIRYKYDATLRPDGDRYSWINPDASQLQASLGGQNLSTGADFKLYLRSSGSSDLIAIVTYTEKGSPAEKAGINRGDVIYSVNGQVLNMDNYSSLLFDNSLTSQTFGLATIQNGALVNTGQTKTASLTTIQKNPVFLDSTYTVNSKKVGYLIYNQFIAGKYDTKGTEYNEALDKVFAKFKSQGISELILDLRYNAGGGGDVATNLASLIAPGISPSNVFFTQQYNKAVTADLQKQYGANFNVVNFINKTANPGTLKRLFILTTRSTASASELVINGLKPYMEVVLIGEVTSGKNVGSTTIVDKTGAIKWGMQPIIVKAFNSAGQSDYTGGFTPTVSMPERIPYKPLGDVTEPLLNEALYRASGTRLARVGASTGLLLPEVTSSALEQLSGGVLVVKLPGQQ